MTNTWKAWASVVLLVTSISASAPVAARDNAPMGTGITKDSLEKDGYKCELVGVGFWECTKSGGTTYWCDTGSCQPKPRRQPGVFKPKLPMGDRVFSPN